MPVSSRNRILLTTGAERAIKPQHMQVANRAGSAGLPRSSSDTTKLPSEGITEPPSHDIHTMQLRNDL